MQWTRRRIILNSHSTLNSPPIFSQAPFLSSTCLNPGCEVSNISGYCWILLIKAFVSRTIVKRQIEALTRFSSSGWRRWVAKIFVYRLKLLKKRQIMYFSYVVPPRKQTLPMKMMSRPTQTSTGLKSFLKISVTKLTNWRKNGQVF